METVTILMLERNGESHIARTFRDWERAQKVAEQYNEILLKSGLRGLYYTITAVVEE